MNMDQEESTIWATIASANSFLESKKPIPEAINTDTSSIALPRKTTPPSSNLHETLVKSITTTSPAGGNEARDAKPASAASVTSRKSSSSSSSPTSSLASSRVTAINLHHHNNLLAATAKKPLNLANINSLHTGSSVSLWHQQQHHNHLVSPPFGSGVGCFASPTKELVASSALSGLGIGGSSITLTAAERAGSVTGGGGRETPFSLLTSVSRLNCLGGSHPGGGPASATAGDHSPGAYWKHQLPPQQQQQFQHQQSTSTYPHSVYGGGGGGNNSSGGNQKVNIKV